MGTAVRTTLLVSFVSLVAGLWLVIGKYRVTLARDAGVNDLGSTYRVGVDMRFR